MKNSLNKLAELADSFERKVAQYTHLTPEQEKNPTSQQVQDRLTQANLEVSLDQVKKNIMEFLALKNPNDMQLSGQYMPQSKMFSIIVTFPNALRQHISNRVAANRKMHPAFSLPTFIQQEVSRLNKNIPARVENLNFS